MKKAVVDSCTSKSTPAPEKTEDRRSNCNAGGSNDIDISTVTNTSSTNNKKNLKSDNNRGIIKVGKDADSSVWDNCDYIFRNRKNPFNGRDCFFSESSFNIVTGPGPSFEEKIMSQISRIKSGIEEQKQADLNKTKPEQKSSSSRDEHYKNTEGNKNDIVMLLPIDVSLGHDIDVEKMASITSRRGDIVQCELVSDAITDVSKQPANLDQTKSVRDGIDIKDVEVSQHTSVLSNESIDLVSADLSAVVDLNNGHENKKPSEIINCALSSDSTSTCLENLANVSNQKLEKLQQIRSDSVVELFRDVEIDQHIPVVSLPANVSKDQGLSDISLVVVAESNSLSRKETENMNCKLSLGETQISTSVLPCPKIHISNSETHLSVSESRCEDNDNTLMMEEKEKKEVKSPMVDGYSTGEDSSTKYSASPPQVNNELCLIMRSLSSDDDDDDFNDTHCPDSSSRHKHICEKDLDKTISTENQPLPKSSGNMIADVNISSSQMSDFVQQNGSSSVDASVIFMHSNYGDPQLQTVIGTENQYIMQIVEGMEMQNHLLCQQSSQENSLDSLHYVIPHTPTPPIQDIDIPIFSVKETSPEPSNCFKSIPIDKNKEKTAHPCEISESELTSDKTSEVAVEAANKTVNFKKSDLTKKEHAMYLKLYNKYIRFFTQAGAIPIVTEIQHKEISLFEKLHKRVLNEQEEFQNYLKENARRNPSSFVFMKRVAKNYATCKARSYRLKSSYTAGFSQTVQCPIPFCQDGNAVDLRFQQALLEVGIPPRIKLPDVQIGHKPVPLEYDIQKLDTYFPRYSKKTLPGFTHHEPVSLDLNVKQLAAKYDFEVVISSSAIKCLLDNHGPNFARKWTVPVHVAELEFSSNPKRVVYLDKPLFENDLHIRDYNTLFHKYALRSFVSYPRQKHAQAQRNLFHQAPHTKNSTTLDDPFDLFSSNVESLETFGTGHSTLFNLNKEASQVVSDKSENKFSSANNVPESPTESPTQVCRGRKLRVNKMQYKDFDDVTCGVYQYGISSNQNTEKLGSSSLAVKRKRAQSSENTFVGDFSGAVENETLSNTDSEPEREPKKNRIGYHMRNEGCLLPKPGNSCNKIQIPNTQLSPVTESPMSPIGETPLSPAGESPLSPVVETPLSPVWETPTSPIKEIPLSPVKNIPLSPLKEAKPSTRAGAWHSSTRSISSNRSPDKRLNNSQDSSTVFSQSSKKDSEKSSFSSGVQHQFFTPLDSILGPCFGQAGGRNVQNIAKEDPSHYLPSSEVHSSIVYNLWSLNSINVLIRTRCHGVIKDHKKTRRVYFSPKMEHQTSYGVEQVTTSEVAKDWTSCYVRPNTNLLRARINAFTSEMMMFEELEPSQILRSSLNFKPEDGFKFVERVLQKLLSLNCGKYLLVHEYGEDFCEIRSSVTGERSEECVVPKKKMSNENDFRWIPVDPTILLPFHIACNRIPATFLPKDVEVKSIHSGGAKRNHFDINHGMNSKNESGTNVHRRKNKKKDKKKSGKC